jgi:hypothetical protein
MHKNIHCILDYHEWIAIILSKEILKTFIVKIALVYWNLSTNKNQHVKVIEGHYMVTNLT